MALPFFYEAILPAAGSHFTVSEETSRHCIQVLRMKTGEVLRLTDGKGNSCEAVIVSEDKKKMVVVAGKIHFTPAGKQKISIAIALLKNANRFEWFLEKATEIGVAEIQPLITQRTEHSRFRMDRMQGIVTAAMLQSQQVWLPMLHEPVLFENCIKLSQAQQKLIAHCEEESKQVIRDLPVIPDTQILIGPEGDFTPQEIQSALSKGYLPVSLGDTRLRTETAGVLAGALLVNR